jgi:hypothetical protein
MASRFPPTWRVVEMAEWFVVKDATVAWFYFRDDPTVPPSAAVLSKSKPGGGL